MPSVVVHRDLLRDCGDFDGRLRVDEDVDFLFRYVALPLVRIYRDANRIGLTTVHPGASLLRIAARETRVRKWASIIDRRRPALRRAVKHYLAFNI